MYYERDDVCEQVIEMALEELERQKKEIKKNYYEDMDIKNVNIMKDIERVVLDMVLLCDSLKSILESYKFEEVSNG